MLTVQTNVETVQNLKYSGELKSSERYLFRGIRNIRLGIVHIHMYIPQFIL